MDDGKILKRQPHLLIIIPIIIIIISALFYVVFFNETSVDEITAMEGEEIARLKILNWNENASPYIVMRLNDSWGYVYVDYSKNISTDWLTMEWMSVFVYDNGTFTSLNGTGILPQTSQWLYPENRTTIKNWVLDSSEAINIAKSNETISELIKQSENYDIIDMQLGASTEHINPYWAIRFEFEGEEIPIYNLLTVITVDATTGEVLEIGNIW